MIRAIICLLAGMSLPFAFAPFNIYTLGFIAPAILFYNWLSAKPIMAFVYGLLFGLGCFGIGIAWIYNSIHLFGNASVAMSVSISLALITSSALFPAAQGYLCIKLTPKMSAIKRCFFIFPASWVIFELLRHPFIYRFSVVIIRLQCNPCSTHRLSTTDRRIWLIISCRIYWRQLDVIITAKQL